MEKTAQTSRHRRGKSSVFRQFQIQCSCYVNLVNTIKVTLQRVRTLIRNGTSKVVCLLKIVLSKLMAVSVALQELNMHVHAKRTNVEKHLAPLQAFVWECVCLNYITKNKALQVYKSEQQMLTGVYNHDSIKECCQGLKE